ncbi:MAG: hypothetical protein U0168_25080 [Nannocystaceae bacterium]
MWLGSTSLPDHDGELAEDCFAWPKRRARPHQREAETVITAACAGADVPLALLRLGELYGPGRELARLQPRGHASPLPGDGMTATNLVHRDDAVAAVHAAIELPRERSGVIHVVDGDHTPRREMLAQACAAASLPRRSGRAGRRAAGQAECAAIASGRGWGSCRARASGLPGFGRRSRCRLPDRAAPESRGRRNFARGSYDDQAVLRGKRP